MNDPWKITGYDALGRLWFYIHRKPNESKIQYAAVVNLLACYEEKGLPFSLTLGELEGIYDKEDWHGKVGLTRIAEQIPMEDHL